MLTVGPEKIVYVRFLVLLNCNATGQTLDLRQACIADDSTYIRVGNFLFHTGVTLNFKCLWKQIVVLVFENLKCW